MHGGRGIRSLALRDKAMIELVNSAKMGAMKNAPKPKPDDAVTWLSDALDGGVAGTFEARAEAEGANTVLWRALWTLARGYDAVRASAWKDARFARFADGVLCDEWGRALAAMDAAPAGSPLMQLAALSMEMVVGVLLGVGEPAATIRALPRTLGAVAGAAIAHPFFTQRQVVTLGDILRVLVAVGEDADRELEAAGCAVTWQDVVREFGGDGEGQGQCAAI